MKRFVSLMIACVILIVTLYQPIAAAEVNTKTYAPVIITVPSKEGDLEQAFRDFVKDVSDMYFHEGYDLNQYYYRASQIKYQWDQGFFVKNNPYSTYSFSGTAADYNKYAILDSLVKGLQKKVDRMDRISVDEYFVGFTFNAATGVWEYDNVKVLEQQIYNNQVYEAIDDTLYDMQNDICNSVVDITTAFVFRGNSPEQFNDLVDAVTAIIAEAMKSRSAALHENIDAILQNELRDAVKEAFLNVNADLDGQLLEALRSEEAALNGKVFSGEEKLRYDQIVYLLDVIKATEDTSMNNNIQQAAENAAEALMDNVGLEVHHVLSEEEINKIVFHDIAIACTKEFTKWIIAALDCSDIPEAILQAGVTGAEQFCVELFEDPQMIMQDYNGDGAYTEMDICMSLMQFFFTKDNLTSIAKAFFQSLVNAGIDKEFKELELLYLNALCNWEYVCKEYADKLGIESPHEVNNMLDEIKAAKEGLAKSDEMLTEIKHQARSFNMGSVKAFVGDIITLCSDILETSKESWSLGDVADNEIFFASIACSMYHTMERAEGMRALINSNYSVYKDHSAIENADLEDLKEFVNCVYSVFELDKTGHMYYTELLAGWDYQSSGKQLKDTEDELMDGYINLIDAYGGLGNVAVLIYGPVFNTIYYWAGTSKSEYLKEVNAQKAWIDAAKSVAVYLQMSNCANQAEMPEVYSGL